MIHKITFSISPKPKTQNDEDDSSLLHSSLTYATQNKTPNPFNVYTISSKKKGIFNLEPKTINQNSNNLLRESKINESSNQKYQTPVKSYKDHSITIQLNHENTSTLFKSKKIKDKEINKEDINHITKGNDRDEKSEYEKLLYYQQLELPVPLDKVDNEKFKLLKIQQMKRQSITMFKSDKKFKELKPNYQEKLDAVNEYSIFKKKKIVHSVMKSYKSFLSLFSNGHEAKFPIFVDKDIGIYEYWQEHIVESVKYIHYNL